MENQMQTLESLIFLVKVTVKFRNLQISKILNTDTNRIFPIPFKVMYVTLRHNFKNNSAVSRSSYLFEPKIFPSKCFFFLIKSINRSLYTKMENVKKRFANISIAIYYTFYNEIDCPN